MSEEDLAAAVVRWFTNQHWEVYQEVQLLSGAPVADLVAVQGPLLWIVECKQTLTFNLFEQVEGWRGYAHFRSMAVPPVSHRSRGRSFAMSVADDYGIGLLEVDKLSGVNVRVDARLDRHAREVDRVRKVLAPEHKTFAVAGNAHGSRWTPFQQTCRDLARFVDENPGTSLKGAVDGIEHHYANDRSARSCLRQWLDAGIVVGVELRKKGKHLRLYPKEKTT